MNPNLKPIETVYKGFRFRSRLEARWAVFFETMGLPWQYEPEGFELGSDLGRYLPDFFIRLDFGGDEKAVEWWIEIKPDFLQIALDKLSRLSAQSGCVGVLFIGLPLDRTYFASFPDGRTAEYGWDDFLTGNMAHITKKSALAARQARFEKRRIWLG